MKRLVSFLLLASLGVLLTLLIVINLSPLLFGTESLGDYGSFHASGQLARAGQNPYAAGSSLIFRPTVLGQEVNALNLNPPSILPLFELIALVDPARGLLMWRIFSIVCYGAALALIWHAFPDRRSLLGVAWAVSVAGLYHVLDMGQIYGPMALGVTCAYLALVRRHYVVGGILIGVLTAVKPNLALWPAALLLIGYWPVTRAAIAAFAVTSALPLVRYDPSIYGAWLSASASFDGYGIPGNSSFVGLSARFNAPVVGYGLAICAVAALGVYSLRARPSLPVLSASALSVALLASPIAWAGYLVLVTPILLSIDLPRLSRCGALLLIVPFPFMYEAGVTAWGAVPFGFLYGWALLLIVSGLVLQSTRQAHTVPPLAS